MIDMKIRIKSSQKKGQCGCYSWEVKQAEDKLLVLGLNKTNVDASAGNLPWTMKGNDDCPF
jgi:hypothetical protein